MTTSRPLSVLSIIIILATTILLSMDCVEASNSDCDKLQTLLEKSICEDQSLNDLDKQLTRTYTEFVQSFSPRDAAKLKKEQIAWLKMRTSSCSIKDKICLRNIYLQRIERLKTIFTHMIDKSQSASSEIDIVTKEINSADPPLKFKIFWKEREEASDSWQAPHGEISMVEIYSTKPFKRIQQIVKPDRNFSIFFDDYNLDGYLDFRLTLSGMLLGNVFSDVYIFDPKTRRYFYSQNLSELTSIRVDPQKKQIYSDNRSARGLSFTYQILTVTDDQLVVLLKRTSDIKLVNGETHLLISEITYDSNGQVISESEKMIKEDELKEEHFPIETIPLSKLP